MTTRKLLYSALALTLCFLCSCINETGLPSPGTGDEVPVKFTLRGFMESDDNTRSIAPIDEMKVELVEILAFVKGGSDIFRYAYTAGILSRSATGGNVEVVAKALGYQAEQIFLILVNAPAGTTSTVTLNMELPTALGKLLVANAGEWHAAASTDFQALPMYTQTDPVNITGNTTIGTYDLVRMLARIDVRLKPGVSNFVITEAHLFNRKTSGQMAFDMTDATLWDATGKKVMKTTYPQAAIPNTYKPSYYDSPGYASTPYKADYTDDARGEILRSIYTFEANGVLEADRLEATAVIVGGKYNSSNDVTYYRIDIATSATPLGNCSQDILRNHLYDIEIQSVDGPGFTNPEDAFIGKKPIEFTVSVTDWGTTHDVPLISLYEPDYFVIDHTYPTEIHLHMVTRNQPFGYLWYTYANVPDGHHSEDVPPAGVQVVPPREHSCASLYSKDPTNPWRLPTRDELLAVRDYAQNNGGLGAYNFELFNDALYWSATARVGIPSQFSWVQLHTQGTGNSSKTSLINGWSGHTRCVRNKTGTGTPPPGGATLTTDADGMYFAAISEVLPIKVTSNAQWIAHIKSGTNLVTTGDASVIGLPLVNQFNGGSPTGYVSGGTAGTNTVNTITITPEDYITDYKEMEGDLTLVFHDAYTGELLHEAVITIGSGEIQPTANCYILKPADKGGKPILIPIYEQVSRATTLGASWLTDAMLTATSGANLLEPVFVWTDVNGATSEMGKAKDATVSNLRVFPKRGSMVDAYLLVMPGSSIGNTVVGIKNGSQIKWSWHIWVTDYDPDQPSGQKPFNGYTLMDRNLGAWQSTLAGLSGYWQTGLHYQWGRKDPFVGATNFTANTAKQKYGETGEVVSFSNTDLYDLATLVSNPGAQSTTNTNGSIGITSWGFNAVKTVFDPCPHGWRVGPSAVFAGLQTAGNTVLLSSGTESGGQYRYNAAVGYFPIAGFYSGSALVYIGTTPYWGGCWTNESYSATTAKNMDYQTSAVNVGGYSGGTNGTNPFVNAFNVRCVKE